MQGQCKPNAESLLYAEVQPVLAISIAKLRQESHENKHLSVFFMRLLRQEPSFATKEEKSMNCCRDSWGLSESLNVAEFLLAIPVYWAR